MTAVELYQEAYNLHYKRKDYNSALNCYLSVIQKYPESPEDRYAHQQITNILKIFPYEAISISPELETVFQPIWKSYSSECHIVQAKRTLNEIQQQTVKEMQRQAIIEQAKSDRIKSELFDRAPKFGKRLCVNQEKRKWTILDQFKYQTIHDFDDLIDYEVSENGTTVQNGRAASATIGALLFGTVGAIVGSSMSKQSREIVSDLHIRIVINQIEAPSENIRLIQYPTEKSSSAFKDAVTDCEQIVSALQFILRNNEQCARQAERARAIYAFSIADEILKFKKLADDGLISKEEFEHQKQKLLQLEY